MEEGLEGWHDGEKVEARLERRVGFGAVNPPWESDFRGSHQQEMAGGCFGLGLQLQKRQRERIECVCVCVCVAAHTCAQRWSGPIFVRV